MSHRLLHFSLLAAALTRGWNKIEKRHGANGQLRQDRTVFTQNDRGVEALWPGRVRPDAQEHGQGLGAGLSLLRRGAGWVQLWHVVVRSAGHGGPAHRRGGRGDRLYHGGGLRGVRPDRPGLPDHFRRAPRQRTGALEGRVRQRERLYRGGHERF